MRSIRIRIPDNLDVKKIIRDNQEMFNKHRLNYPKLMYILNAFADAAARQSEEIEQDGIKYVRICSGILNEVVYNYEHYMRFLIKVEIFETDYKDKIGSRCRGYRYTALYAGKPFTTVMVEDKMLNKAVEKGWQKYVKERDESIVGFEHLAKPFKSGLLRIDEKGAFKWLDSYYDELIAEVNKKSGSLAQKETFANKLVTAKENQKNLVLSINTGRYRYGFVGESHRFYSPITAMKRELRRFLTYSGKRLVSYDISNSQALLSVALFRKSFWELPTNLESSKCMASINPSIYHLIYSSPLLSSIINLTILAQGTPRQSIFVKAFEKKVGAGKLYDHIKDELKFAIPDKTFSKEDIKSHVLKSMYLNHNETWVCNYQEYKSIRAIFPLVFKMFETIKEIRPNLVAIILQSIESYLVLNVVCRKIAEQLNDTLALTVHDSILTTEENMERVRTVFEGEIRDWLGVAPTIKEERLDPTLLIDKLGQLVTLPFEITSDDTTPGETQLIFDDFTVVIKSVRPLGYQFKRELYTSGIHKLLITKLEENYFENGYFNSSGFYRSRN